MMSNKSKKLIQFLIVLCLLLAGVSWLAGPKGYKAYDIVAVRRKVNAMKSEPDNSLDVLFVGDSESCDVYSPFQLWGEYGFTSYNTGSAAQRISDGYAILKQELQHQSPKLVVIEANTLFRDWDIYNKGYPGEYITERIIPLTHYHSFYKVMELPEWFIAQTGQLQNANQMKGFWLRKTSRPYTGSAAYMERETKKQSMAEGTKSYFEKTVQLCKDNNIPVLVVASPSPKNWTEGRYLAISEWCSQNDVGFIDLNHYIVEIGLDWSKDSLDYGDHVNFDGTLKVNTYLGQKIQSLYNLPDRRKENSSISDSWNEQYQKLGIYGGNS